MDPQAGPVPPLSSAIVLLVLFSPSPGPSPPPKCPTAAQPASWEQSNVYDLRRGITLPPPPPLAFPSATPMDGEEINRHNEQCEHGGAVVQPPGTANRISEAEIARMAPQMQVRESTGERRAVRELKEDKRKAVHVS